MRPFSMRLLLTPTGTEGGGNGSDAGAGSGGGTDATKGTPQNPPAADGSKGYEAALKKHGDDASAMAREVYRDNERLRAELTEAKGKAPGDGAVVLNKADAARWAELGTLGGLDKVKTQLADGQAAVTSVAKFEREKLIGKAAGAVGYDPEVLASLAGDLAIEVKEETKGGKQVRTAEVVTWSKNDKGEEVETRTELAKHAEAAWPKFLPSLKVAVSDRPRVGGTPQVRTPTVRTPAGQNAGTEGTDRPAPPRRRLSL